MRIHISTTPNTELVPYTYQQRLVGAFHKWLGSAWELSRWKDSSKTHLAIGYEPYTYIKKGDPQAALSVFTTE